VKKALIVTMAVLTASIAQPDTERIIKLLEQANQAAQGGEGKAEFLQKSPQEILQELREAKEMSSIKAEEGEFNEAAINRRIGAVVKYFEEQAKSEQDAVSIKSYGFFENCEGQKCTKMAIVKLNDIKDATAVLKEQSNEFRQKAEAARALYSVSPIATRKTRIERLEEDMLMQTTQTANTSFSTTDTSGETTMVQQGERIDGLYVAEITNMAIVLKKK